MAGDEKDPLIQDGLNMAFAAAFAVAYVLRQRDCGRIATPGELAQEARDALEKIVRVR